MAYLPQVAAERKGQGPEAAEPVPGQGQRPGHLLSPEAFSEKYLAGLKTRERTEGHIWLAQLLAPPPHL